MKQLTNLDGDAWLRAPFLGPQRGCRTDSAHCWGLMSPGLRLMGPTSRWLVLPLIGHLGHTGPCASCSPLEYGHRFSRTTLWGSIAVSILTHFTDEKTEAWRG